MKRISLGLCALAAVLVTACGDNLSPPPGGDDDAAVDAAPTTIGPCLDRPEDLPRPPTGTLPCELIPPGLTLAL